MGLLDDAIREHLELKKRSGAPEEEVLRLETEAFGPARSAAIPPSPAAPDEPVPPHEAPEVAAPEPEPEPEPEPAPAPPEPPPAPTADWLDDEPDEVPAADALDHGATSEFTAADHAAAAGTAPTDYVEPDEEDADDVLEETPDFLQETPEHERLWFEQKPPRDFDFDE